MALRVVRCERGLALRSPTAGPSQRLSISYRPVVTSRSARSGTASKKKLVKVVAMSYSGEGESGDPRGAAQGAQKQSSDEPVGPVPASQHVPAGVPEEEQPGFHHERREDLARKGAVVHEELTPRHGTQGHTTRSSPASHPGAGPTTGDADTTPAVEGSAVPEDRKGGTGTGPTQAAGGV